MDEKLIAEIVAKTAQDTADKMQKIFDEKRLEDQKALIVEAQKASTNVVVGDAQFNSAPNDDKIFSFMCGVATGNQELIKKSNPAFYAKAMNEGTNTAGGYLVPPEYIQQIVQYIEDYGIARALCRVIPTKSNIVYLPKHNTGVTVSWLTEGTAPTATDNALTQITHTIKKLGGTTVFSNELFADSFSNPDLVKYLLQTYAEKIAQEEDTKFINGLVASGPLFSGFLENPTVVTATTTHTTYATITYDDVLKLYTGMSGKKVKNAAFITHRSINRYLMGLVDPFNRPIYTVNGPEQKLFGLPLIVSEEFPSTDGVTKPVLALSNFKDSYQFVDRQEMRMSLDTSVKFLEDQTAMKVTERISIQPAIAGNVAVLKTAAS